MISTDTRIVGIFGDPANGSLSPAMHNAAFAHLGLDWAYLPFNIDAEHLPAAVKAIRIFSWRGVNVTMPHKAAVIPHLDKIDERAARINSVNTIVNDGGCLTGHSTDGEGFLRALLDNDTDVNGANVRLIGTGGAARAVADAIAKAGASSITVFGRNETAGLKVCAISNAAAGKHICEFKRISDRSNKDTPDADIFVNATPLGKQELDDDLTFLVNELKPTAVAVDLSTVPPLSAFLVAAQLRGCKTANGLGMLVHQGSISFEMWTGRPAPLDVMRKAVGETT